MGDRRIEWVPHCNARSPGIRTPIHYLHTVLRGASTAGGGSCQSSSIRHLDLALAVGARSSCREKQTRLIFQVQIHVLAGKGCNSNQAVSPMASALTFLFGTTTDTQGAFEMLHLGKKEEDGQTQFV